MNLSVETKLPTSYLLRLRASHFWDNCTAFHNGSPLSGTSRGSGPENGHFFKWPPNHFWVFESTLLGVDMISWKFCKKKLTGTFLFGVSNIEPFRANKKFHFTCCFELSFQKPEHMHMDHLKNVKLLIYMCERSMQSFRTRFQHQVCHWGY